MKTIIITNLLLLLVSLNNVANAQEFVWAKQMGGTGYEEGAAIVVDASGNVYSTGFFQLTADFDPGPGVFNLTSAGSNDIFISKLDATGNFLWAKQIGGTLSDEGLSIALDASGNVYTAGYFNKTVDFDPDVGVVNLISKVGGDAFVLKLDANGKFVWATQMSAISAYSSVNGSAISLDASGNVYTTGSFAGIVDFDPGLGEFKMISPGGGSTYILKLNAAGNFVWAIKMDGSKTDAGVSMAHDASGNTFVTGKFFSETVDFDPGPEVYSLTPVGGNDIYILKLNAAGNFVWVKQMGGAGTDLPSSISLDAAGNIYTTGYFDGSESADFDPGPGVFSLKSAGGYDVFISKLDVEGNFVWAKKMGEIRSDFSYSICNDDAGNVYTTGDFQFTMDFDPGPGIFNLTSGGSSEVFISKLDTDGNFVWAIQMGGSSANCGKSIKIDPLGNIHTTGYFEKTADFNPGTDNFNLSSEGKRDIFISKLSNVTLSVEDKYTSSDIQLYPNPFNTSTTIQLNTPIHNGVLKVYNVNGQLVKEIQKVSGQTLTIHRDNVPNGLYFISLTEDNKLIISKKIIITD